MPTSKVLALTRKLPQSEKEDKRGGDKNSDMRREERKEEL